MAGLVRMLMDGGLCVWVGLVGADGGAYGGAYGGLM